MIYDEMSKFVIDYLSNVIQIMVCVPYYLEFYDKRMIRVAKRQSWKKFGEKMEIIAKRTKKSMRKEKTIQTTHIKNEEGAILTNETEVMT